MIRRPVQRAERTTKCSRRRQQLSDELHRDPQIDVNSAVTADTNAGIGQFGVQCTLGNGFAVQGDVMLKILGGNGRIPPGTKDGTVDWNFTGTSPGSSATTFRPVSSTFSTAVHELPACHRI